MIEKSLFIQADIFEKTINAWGEKFQVLMAVEEMAELQKVLLKDANRNKKNLEEIIDETADVIIMMQQIMHVYKIHDRVNDKIAEKINRLKSRYDNWVSIQNEAKK
ncbi:MAG: hypothetical protein LBU87_04420 [Lactobacillales bacterium]|jgi:NTP pyrophosphatase (non-canonical NTP hydrolase)|nr:hypothetical protein [Lactobacillales bacterium]